MSKKEEKKEKKSNGNGTVLLFPWQQIQRI